MEQWVELQLPRAKASSAHGVSKFAGISCFCMPNETAVVRTPPN